MICIGIFFAKFKEVFRLSDLTNVYTADLLQSFALSFVPLTLNVCSDWLLHYQTLSQVKTPKLSYLRHSYCYLNIGHLPVSHYWYSKYSAPVFQGCSITNSCWPWAWIELHQVLADIGQSLMLTNSKAFHIPCSALKWGRLKGEQWRH